ncbi:DUF1549 domain-containing protein [Cerasicoccus arenae]|uniref:Cytochrome c domain-containing protein n=2 Tax=Cerasicoccus arenae TaxID=424488 RepID=A0A8J3DB54_9BACT|nr:DUF1549 domain-containing protein [Cerasicoccus arenae]MBK1856777.1 DUF1549 domain-containing protein [Cerasicoccus arenae]GHB99436.1 hypothetical protein GCM10007047_14600 [Cerasicoccus arenae]
MSVWAEKPAESVRIDAILEAHWKEKGVQGEAIVDDQIFLRRTYLTVAGRIPSYEEAQTWLASQDVDKRNKLIEQLIESEGFVNQQFNLWADALRIRTTGRDGDVSGGKYFVPWLKNQLRANTPYNVWVREILAAEGAPWDNPASSYYLRDVGMPLDNMAITMQVFLGTQMQCAQCHDHPTDVWTRRDFYEMAAFRYAVNTRRNYGQMEPLQPLLKELQERKLDGLSDKEKKKMNADKLLNPAGRDLFRSMRWQTTRNDRKLKFPDDYQYEDVPAKSVVDPHTIFGESPDVKKLKADDRAEFYANWITSTENPRFTVVIANRVWKSVMGRGALEPIDDIRGDSQSEVPGLSEELTAIMHQVNYDLKAYYRILLETDYFQRSAVVFDSENPDSYHFTGPTLRRLSAEQLWDSYVVLLKPDIDNRPENYQDPLPPPPGPVQLLSTFTPEQMADYLDSAEKAWKERQDARTAFYRVRSDPEKADTEEYKELKQTHQAAEKKWRSYSNVSDAMMMMGEAEEQDATEDQKKKGKKPQWWERNLARAADLNSPENVDHWLRVFGQSDRDIVDNADETSTVNQALLLLNSGETNSILTEKSDPVKRAKEAKDPIKALEALTIGFLTRQPSEQEKAYLLAQWETNPKLARERMAWAMVNTQEFLFLQ